VGNRPGGNNPLGRSGPTSGRYGGDSILQISIDIEGLKQEIRKWKGDFGRVERAAEQAGQALADSLVSYQEQVLQEKIDDHGRPQYRGDKLFKALSSPQNRSVNAYGFTVGRLDNIPSVRSYWRGIEFGTSAHIGQFLPGYFVDAAGAQVPFTPGGRDRFVVRSSDKRGAPKVADPTERTGKRGGRKPFRARIKNPTTGYHFQAEGYKRWARNDGSSKVIMETYVFYCKRAGIELGLGPGAVARTTTGFKTKPAPAPKR